MDLNGQVTDYFTGKEDLQNKLVRFVGNAELRIQEDYLRILRYFRFVGYLGVDNIDDVSFKACTKHVSAILNLSGERVRNEMLKIFAGKYLKEIIKMMIEAGVLELYGLNIKHEEIQSYNFSDEAVVNLASVILLRKGRLPDIGAKWKLSNNMQKTLQLLTREIGDINVQRVKELRYRYGKKNALLICKLAQVINLRTEHGVEEIINNYEMPMFPINGNDLLALGYQGKELGEKLTELEQQWINSDFSITKESLLKQ
jgi:poly(A) polymerase